MITKVLGDIMLSLLFKLLTEKAVSRFVVIGLRECARRTHNKWDDDLVVLIAGEIAPDMLSDTKERLDEVQKQAEDLQKIAG